MIGEIGPWTIDKSCKFTCLWYVLMEVALDSYIIMFIDQLSLKSSRAS